MRRRERRLVCRWWRMRPLHASIVEALVAGQAWERCRPAPRTRETGKVASSLPWRLAEGRGINPAKTGRPDVDTYDYVIVGAGSAGSVLANRLSEDGTASVLVLEAGPSDWHPYIHMPAGFIKTFHIPSVNWLYHMEPSQWTGGRRILPRAARRWAASARSMAMSTTAASAWISTPGRSSATTGGATPTCSPTSGAWSAASAMATRLFAAATARLRLRPRLAPPALRGLHRGRRQPRHPAQPRLQRRRPGGRRLRPAHHQQRPPGQRRHRLPASRAQAGQRRGAHARAEHRAAVRGQALRGRRLQLRRPRRRELQRAGRARGDPVGRQL